MFLFLEMGMILAILVMLVSMVQHDSLLLYFPVLESLVSIFSSH